MGLNYKEAEREDQSPNPKASSTNPMPRSTPISEIPAEQALQLINITFKASIYICPVRQREGLYISTHPPVQQGDIVKFLDTKEIRDAPERASRVKEKAFR